MAETRVARETQPDTVPAEPKKKSPVRTLVLFGVLLLVIGAYAHDYFVAAPAAKAAHDKIQQLVDDRNAQGVKAAELVTSKDVQAAIGKQPSKTDKQKNYTVEVYRFWGGMLPQRQYISVLYLGDEEPRRHHVHYLNSMPFEDDYPTETKIPTGSAEGESGDAEGPGPGPDGVGSEDEAPASEEAPTDAEESPAAPTSESPAASSSGESSDEKASEEPAATETSADPPANPAADPE